MQHYGSKYFARRHPFPHDPRGLGQKVKIQLFQNMVMMHIKLNEIMKCNKMVANILPADHPPHPMGQNVIIQLFPNNVMLHIKLKGVTKCRNVEANILSADPSPTLGVKMS